MQELDPGTPQDSGFGLVEALVGALLLALFSVGISGLIVVSLNVSQLDRQRVAATGLATRELEIVREQFRRSDDEAKAIVAQGLVVNAASLSGTGPSRVDGTSYTVTREVAWAPTGNGVDACDGGAAISYPSAKVRVQVTWPDMRGVAPVVDESILTPSKRQLTGTYSFVAVRVLDFAGKEAPGHRVTAVGPAGTLSQLSDSSGCAVFGIASAGNYTFSMQEAGYVDFQSQATSVKPLPVAAGTFQRLSFTWDDAVVLQASPATEPGHQLPIPLPGYTVRNADLPSPGTRKYPNTGTPTALGQLGPYTNGISVWAGLCADADPSGPPTSSAVTPVAVAGGQTVPVQVRLAPVEVSSPARPGQVVTATTTSGDPTCSPTLTLGTTGADGVLLGSLPYGSWSVKVGSSSAVVVRPSATGVTEVPVA